MRKSLLLALLALPLTAAAQLPIPVIPDWLRPADHNAQVLNQTHVTLAENNFTILQPNVIARSRGFKLLGLISLRSATYTEAMSRLYKRAHVQEGRPQAMANIVHESSSTFLILFSIPKVTIRADLIEFTGQGDTDEPMGDPTPVLLGSGRRANLGSAARERGPKRGVAP